MAFQIDPEFRTYWTPQTKEERAALKLKIETEGPRPGSIVLARLPDKSLWLIDGHNTAEICKELGIALPQPVIYKLPNRESVLEWIDENQRARRNAPPDVLARRAQERRERVAQARADGKSTRAIAEAEGVSQTTVRADLEVATEQGGSVEPPGGKVTGRDGRSRQAARRGRPARPSKSGEPAFDRRVVTEHLGKALAELDKLARQHGLVTPRGRVRETPAHLGLRRLLEQFDIDLEKWRRDLKKQSPKDD